METTSTHELSAVVEATPPAANQDHPHPDQLEDFMTNRLSRPETARVLRHLLRGCPQCSRVTGRLWRLGR